MPASRSTHAETSRAPALPDSNQSCNRGRPIFAKGGKFSSSATGAEALHGTPPKGQQPFEQILMSDRRRGLWTSGESALPPGRRPFCRSKPLGKFQDEQRPGSARNRRGNFSAPVAPAHHPSNFRICVTRSVFHSQVRVAPDNHPACARQIRLHYHDVRLANRDHFRGMLRRQPQC
jgi:hypothetical protein